jgi:hypothetical protein
MILDGFWHFACGLFEPLIFLAFLVLSRKTAHADS